MPSAAIAAVRRLWHQQRETAIRRFRGHLRPDLLLDELRRAVDADLGKRKGKHGRESVRGAETGALAGD